jgi:DNA-binding CsgD family transcriptional regulator
MSANLDLLIRELRTGVEQGAGPQELGEVVSGAVGRWVASGSAAWIEPFAAELSLRIRERAGEPVIRSSLTNAGRWVAIHGQPLDKDAVGDVATVFQAASGDLLLNPFCHWHGITARERRVIEHLYHGAAPKQIARDLTLSAHAINDHLRAIYRKTGADGRDSLIAALMR